MVFSNEVNLCNYDSISVEVSVLLVLSLLNGNGAVHGRKMGTCGDKYPWSVNLEVRMSSVSNKVFLVLRNKRCDGERWCIRLYIDK